MKEIGTSLFYHSTRTAIIGANDGGTKRNSSFASRLFDGALRMNPINKKRRHHHHHEDQQQQQQQQQEADSKENLPTGAVMTFDPSCL